MLGRTKKDQEPDVRSGQGAAGAAAENDAQSIISGDMSIRGECETPGQVRIEGRVAGTVTAGGVELAPSGKVQGDVVARSEGQRGHPFIIGGSVTGSVRAGRVEVRRGGSVSGGVVADEAVIQGRVYGGVQARTRLALARSAEVEGDVLARRLSLEEGGQVNGTIRMGDNVGFDEPEKAEEAARPLQAG
jgi:cytoskeletal protein CcmA (bactofilin family)